MSTVSLDIAQKMRPRPPSMLMYKTNFEKQMHEMNTGEHPEEKADETFMWMEDTLKEDTANQTIIKAYPDNEEAIDTKNSSFSTSEEEEEEEEDRPWYEVNLIEWSNSHLQSTKIDDLSESFRSGKILIELLESVSGQTISKDTNTPDNNIAEAFQFMADIGVEENEYSAQGRPPFSLIVNIN